MMYSRVLLPLPDGPMIETASPRDRESETSETILSGPRGVGYSFETFSTFSTSPPGFCRGFARINADQRDSRTNPSHHETIPNYQPTGFSSDLGFIRVHPR